jgi:hypothetical protein
MAVLDPILQAGAAVLGKTLVEHEIQALSGFIQSQFDPQRRAGHGSPHCGK